jgi:hypothetical protein
VREPVGARHRTRSPQAGRRRRGHVRRGFPACSSASPPSARAQAALLGAIGGAVIALKALLH